ncbi:MAG: hypothetical protein ACLQDV_25265 [Candidatus Binataceae bacterium]
MKRLDQQNPLVLALAIVGVGALLYAGWSFYEQRATDEKARALLAAPTSPGIPDIIHQPGAKDRKDLPPQN